MPVDPLVVPCDYCGAAAGAKCRTVTRGTPIQGYHKARTVEADATVSGPSLANYSAAEELSSAPISSSSDSPRRGRWVLAVVAAVAVMWLWTTATNGSGAPRQTLPSAPTTPVGAAAQPGTVATEGSPSPTPSWVGDQAVPLVALGAKPRPPKLLPTRAAEERVGALCRDGSESDATGRGACSWHGGVAEWLVALPYWAEANKEENAARKAAYRDALKVWQAKYARNSLIKRYPCSKGPYTKTSPGYAIWRDSNRNGVACEPLVQEE